MSARENTYWRDAAISQRHRQWGMDCPATDVDFFLIEYDRGLPCAVVDYKHGNRADPLAGVHPGSARALGGLYDHHGRQLPYFTVLYHPGTAWRFQAKAMNTPALRWLDGNGWQDLTEAGWVRLLHSIRRNALDPAHPPGAQQHPGRDS